MRAIDIVGLALAFLGLSGIFFSLRWLLPRNVVPLVSASHDEAMALFEHAVAINTPNVSVYRTRLAMYAHVHTHQPRSPLTKPSFRNQFLQMRTESHRSPGFFKQIYLLFLCGLTWRLYNLKSEIDAIRRRIQLAVDEQQLAFLTNVNTQNTTTTALPASMAGTGGTHALCHGFGDAQ
jgi:hypothetical protein